MDRRLSFWTAFKTLLTGLVASYVLCIVGDAVLGTAMYAAWAPLLPGFVWPVTAGGFLAGLAWLVVYAAYIPAVLLLPYRYFTREKQAG